MPNHGLHGITALQLLPDGYRDLSFGAGKAMGKYKGGQPKLTQEQIASLKQLVADGMPKAAADRKFKISREAVYQYLK